MLNCHYYFYWKYYCIIICVKKQNIIQGVYTININYVGINK